MSKLKIISIFLLFVSCENIKTTPWVIKTKFYNVEDKPCICTYYYNQQSFEDSCKKYNVGDTIKF